MKDYLSLAKLDRLGDSIIRGVLERSLTTREGIVMTSGLAAYRRIDCDGRALAYVRSRVRKKIVRIDISGLWLATRRSPLAMANAGGSLTLIVKSDEDREEAIQFLVGVVEDTRAAVERRVRLRDRGDGAPIDTVT